MKKIIILDFSTATVYIREAPHGEIEADDVMESMCNALNIRSNDCEYMIGEFTIDDSTT